MKTYYLFLKDNVPYVGFGWLATFFSSFGQTFLISLYVPSLLTTFGLTKGQFGTMYALCTIVASAIMLRYGPCIDYKPVRQITNYTIFGLSVSCLLFGASFHPAMLAVALIGLRLTGQGMMSHISLTLMSRYYDKDRGKALSLSSLGYSMGEIVFPVLLTFIIISFGWRWAAATSGVLLLLVLLPILFKIELEAFDLEEEEAQKIAKTVSATDYFYLLRDRAFWILAPASFIIGFIVTSLFFYQLVIAEERGWPYEIYSLLFMGYALTKLCFSLLGGNWIDRFSARKVFSYYLMPLLFGLLSLAMLPGLTGAAIFLGMMGVASGLSSPVVSALIAELYGVERLGSVRSFFTMTLVVSTALGPMLVGILMDFGFSITSIVLVLASFTLATIINGFRLNSSRDTQLNTAATV